MSGWNARPDISGLSIDWVSTYTRAEASYLFGVLKSTTAPTIAVAERFEIHPQTLRLYEREGLIRPTRSAGNTRLYDEESIERGPARTSSAG